LYPVYFILHQILCKHATSHRGVPNDAETAVPFDPAPDAVSVLVSVDPPEAGGPRKGGGIAASVCGGVRGSRRWDRRCGRRDRR
jgi:hypothetical protein